MARSATFAAATSNGGGAILTDGEQRFTVSDWSPGTGDVYGYPVNDDGTAGSYGRLPEDLYLDDQHIDRLAVAGDEFDTDPAFGR